jgi:hypothetical protein
MPDKEEVVVKTKKVNGWITFVAGFRKDHPGMSYVDALKEAAPSYHASKK